MTYVTIFSMLSPEEDFGSWAEILKVCIDSGSQLGDVLPSFNASIKQIVEHGHLAAPLRDQTAFFLRDVVKSVISGILGMDVLVYDTYKPVEESLIAAGKLVVWAAIRDDFELVSAVIGVFNTESEVYVRNSNSYYGRDVWLHVVNSFFDDDRIQLLCDRICGDIPPLLEHFDILFGLYERFEKYLRVEDTVVVACLPAFGVMLDDMIGNDAKDIDLAKFQATVTSLMNFLGKFQADADDVFRKVFCIAEGLLTSGVLPKQIVGGQIVATGKGAAWEMIAFEEWTRTTKLRDMVVERDLHPQLLDVIENVMADLLDENGLVALAEKVEHVHSSDKPRVLNLIKQCLRELDTTAAMRCVDALGKRREISVEFLMLVGTSFFRHSYNRCDKLYDMVAIGLLDAGEVPEKRDRVLTAVHKIADGNHDETQRALVKESVERVKRTEGSICAFSCSVLVTMARHLKRFDVFPEGADVAVASVVKHTDISDEVRAELVELLALIVEGRKLTLTVSVLQDICEARDPRLLWRFL